MGSQIARDQIQQKIDRSLTNGTIHGGRTLALDTLGRTGSTTSRTGTNDLFYCDDLSKGLAVCCSVFFPFPRFTL